MTNILIAITKFDAGGAERQAGYLAEGLMAKGYKVTILAFGKTEGLSYKRFNAAGLTCLATGFREKLILTEGRGLKARLLCLKYRRKLVLLVKKLKVDVIIPFTYAPNVIYGQLWKKMDAKACYWNQRDEGRGFLGRPFELKALANCISIISNSIEGVQFLTRYTNRQISIIRNGVEIPSRQVDTIEVIDEFKVVMVANLHYYKDHMTLLKAWKLFMEQSPKARLILVGKEGDAYQELVEYVADHQLYGSVDFVGLVDQVSTILASCHLGVFSSDTEGVPNGILECMAVGLPVIATEGLGSQEALGDHYPFYVGSGDVITWSRKINELYLNPELRRNIGNQNFERVSTHFSLSQMIEQYQELIEFEISQ